MWRHLWWAVAAVMVFAGTAAAQRVTKVPSGDTIVVAGVGEVRLAGILSVDEPALDTGNPAPAPAPPPPSPIRPATPILGGAYRFDRDRPSRDFLRKLLLGRTVRLQRDTLANADDGQRVYVFLPGGVLVNAEMLRQGKARVDLALPFEHQEEFKRLAAEAEAAGVGVWATIDKK
jgi:endonuclease YncB( thermonuclease family)